MTTFDKREEAYEAKFAHDEELAFKAAARRNKLLGLWAAEKLGFSEEKAENYAKEVVRSDFDEPGDEDVHRKVLADLEAATSGITSEALREKMDELMSVAIDQIKNEG